MVARKGLEAQKFEDSADLKGFDTQSLLNNPNLTPEQLQALTNNNERNASKGKDRAEHIKRTGATPDAMPSKDLIKQRALMAQAAEFKSQSGIPTEVREAGEARDQVDLRKSTEHQTEALSTAEADKSLATSREEFAKGVDTGSDRTLHAQAGGNPDNLRQGDIVSETSDTFAG